MKTGDARGAPPAVVTSEAVRVTAPLRPLKLETPVVAATTALSTYCVVASLVVPSWAAAVGAVGVPVKAGLASGAPPTEVMSESERLTAPLRPFQLVTAPAVIAVPTKAVVASD